MPAAAERIPEILETYEKDPAETLRQLDEASWTHRDGVALLEAEAVGYALRSRGAEFFVAYLLRRDELFPLVLNPHALSMDDATSALKLAMNVDPGCDVAKLQELAAKPSAAESLTRLIDLASRVRLSGRLRPILQPLLRHENPFLSSKVELLLKRLDQTEKVLRQRLKDPDPRVQADAVESIWGEDTPESREVFRKAVNSPNDRLVGNGLYGLYLVGDNFSVRTVFDLAENQSPLVRPTAIWFMGQTGDPRFLPWLVEAMGTNDNRLRSRIFQAIRQIRERRAQAAAAGKLRLHVLSAALQGQRQRVVRFVVAGSQRPVLHRFLATHIQLSENGQPVQDFSLHLAPVRSAAIAIFCCGGVEPPTELQSLAGSGCSIEVRNIAAAGAEREIAEFISGPATDAIVLTGTTTTPELLNASALVDQLRSARKRVHGVWPESVGVRQSLPLDALARGTGGLAVRYRESCAAGMEQAVLASLGLHELRYEAAAPSQTTVSIQLQMLNHHGIGDASSLLVHRREGNGE